MSLIPHHFSGLAAVALLGLGLAAPLAMAQETPPMPSASPPAAAAPSPAPAAQPATHARPSRVDQYITSLHRRLMITPAQQSQWDAVASVMRENAARIDQLTNDREQKRSSMSAVDNLRSYEEIADAHADDLKQLVPAFEALYDVMSPAQKKNADKIFAAQPARTARRS